MRFQGYASRNTPSKGVLLVLATGLLAPLAVAPRLVAGQKITVRVLGANSGKPLRNLPIIIFQYRRLPPPPAAPEGVSKLSLRTDRKGEATLEVHRPLPAFMNVGTPGALWSDPDMPPTPTVRILDEGVIFGSAPKRRKSQVKIAPKPGEIIIVGRRWTRWDRLWTKIPWGIEP